MILLLCTPNFLCEYLFFDFILIILDTYFCNKLEYFEVCKVITFFIIYIGTLSKKLEIIRILLWHTGGFNKIKCRYFIVGTLFKNNCKNVNFTNNLF